MGRASRFILCLMLGKSALQMTLISGLAMAPVSPLAKREFAKKVAK
jgi:hypothetical protein